MGKLTFMENYVWDTLGWFFCAIAFSTPDWLVREFGGTYAVGNWFYGVSYRRQSRERQSG